MKTIKNWNQFNESARPINFEMTGSPRGAMQMLPARERTKDVFATELEKHGYKRSRLNKNCDLLVAEDLNIWTLKMKKAEEMGVEVTTYDQLIKQHKLFKNLENVEYDDEVGKLELWWDGKGPSTWFYITDAIRDGIMDEKLQLDDDTVDAFGEFLGEEIFDMDELEMMIEQDFDDTLDKLFDWLIAEGGLDHKPTVGIKGTDENGEEFEFYYSPEMKDKDIPTRWHSINTK